MTGTLPTLPKVIQGATPLFGSTLVAEPNQLLDEVHQAGVTAFDSGLVYADEDGTCDGRLGAWVASRGVRDSVLLIGKGCHPGPPDWSASRVNPQTVAVDIALTLDRMGTDRIDLWLFHRDNADVPVWELVDAAQREVAAGRIDAWGVSNWSTDRFLAARAVADAAPPMATSPQFSLVDQLDAPWPDVTTVSGSDHLADRNHLAAADVSVICWSPLAGGFLTATHQPGSANDPETTRCYDSPGNRGRRNRCLHLAETKGCSPEQVAIAYVAAAPFRSHVVCAARVGQEAAANLAATLVDLDDGERRWLEEGPSASQPPNGHGDAAREPPPQT